MTAVYLWIPVVRARRAGFAAVLSLNPSAVGLVRVIPDCSSTHVSPEPELHADGSWLPWLTQGLGVGLVVVTTWTIVAVAFKLQPFLWDAQRRWMPIVDIACAALEVWFVIALGALGSAAESFNTDISPESLQNLLSLRSGT